MGEWQNGIFGCFSNCSLCIITWFVPCYTVGKNAEALGESCLYNCLLVLIPIVNIIIMCQQRGKIRQRQDISGGSLRDLCWTLFCPLCALTQEAAECADLASGAMAIDRT